MEFLKTSIELVKWGIISGIFLGISLAFTGPFLVLKKNALFPHALTHVLFLVLIILSIISPFLSSFFYYPLVIFLTLIAVSGIWLLKKIQTFYEDTATSIITHLALALALVIAVKNSQYDIRLFSYLFGSLLTVTSKDTYESLFILILSLFFYLNFKGLWITQILEQEVPGVSFKLANLSFLFLITLQTLIGIKILGVLLVSSFFIFPSVVALSLSSSLKKVILVTMFLNFLALIGGLLISLFWDLPFSASTVIFMGFYFLIILFFKRKKKMEF